MRYLNACAGTIGWADYTWNPATGCENDCEYCYARRLARRFGKTEDERNFKPAFHPERLEAPSKLKTPSRIFVCSNADLFGDWVLAKMILPIISICWQNPQHRFLFLTKNPERYRNFKFPGNCWIGTTITNQTNYHFRMTLPNRGIKTFISIEPLLGEIYFKDYKYFGFKWLIVGAQTPYSAKTAPKAEWVQSIIDFARKYEIPLYLKDSLRWPEVIKEFPQELIFE